MTMGSIREGAWAELTPCQNQYHHLEWKYRDTEEGSDFFSGLIFKISGSNFNKTSWNIFIFLIEIFNIPEDPACSTPDTVQIFFFLARLYGALNATVSYFYENIFVKNPNLTPGHTPQNTFFWIFLDFFLWV